MNSVEICNLSLNMLGMPAIATLNDSSEQANLCRRFFSVCRQRALRDHYWSFATKVAPLQLVGQQSPLPEWKYMLKVPADCLRVVELVGGYPFRRWGEWLLANVIADLVYIGDVEDSELLDVTFVEALQFMLAADLAMAATQNAQLANFYRSQYQERLAVARSIDSSENIAAYKSSCRESTYLAARGIGGNCAPGTGTPVKFIKGTEGRQGGIRE